MQAVDCSFPRCDAEDTEAWDKSVPVCFELLVVTVEYHMILETGLTLEVRRDPDYSQLAVADSVAVALYLVRDRTADIAVAAGIVAGFADNLARIGVAAVTAPDTIPLGWLDRMVSAAYSYRQGA